MRSNTFDRSDSQQMPAHSVEKRVVAESIRSVLKSKSDVVKISESKMLRKSVLNYHKGLGNLEMCEKLDKTLIKNMHDVYQSFATMDQNLYHIKTRAEEEKDQKLKTHSDNIEKEQQNIKNIMTASFQKMKDFLEAFKTVQESSSSKEDCNTFQNSEVKEENQVSDEGRGSHINPDADQSEQVDQADQKVADDDDSDNDTIFYDAYDAMILSELEQEVERGPKIDQTEEEKVEEERLTLPALKSEGKFSLLKVLKDAVGRDLTKF